MSQESYSFACPVCAVRLSVPKALAGVRGPCPQCHHEITAPEPESVLVPALAGVAAGASRAPASSPREEADLPGPPPPVPPALVAAPAQDRLPPPLPAAMPVPDLPPEPPPVVVEVAPALEMEEVVSDEATWPDRAALPKEPVVRRSKLGLALAVLVGLALLAAAALNFFPRHVLQSWLGRTEPAAAGGSAIDPAPAPAGFDGPSVVPIQTVDATAPSSPAEIREAAVPAESSAPLAAPSGESPSFPGDPAITPTENEPPTVLAPPPIAAPPVPPRRQAGPASLLPDISGGDPPADDAVSEARGGAQEALTLFLQAKSWKDRLALSHEGETHRAEMEAYYRKAKDGPNAPTSVEHIASAPLPDGPGTVEVFHVTFADLPQGFPVPVFQTDDGWKIDWQAFVEFRESRLKKFLAQPQDAPAIFRVRLQRAHYQDQAVPNLDQKYIFRVAAPIDGHEGYAFVDKNDSIVIPKLNDNLQWDAIDHVMVKLKWIRGGNGRNYVELRDIVSTSWRPAP